MTVAATTNRADFVGTGTTGPFAVPFPLYAQSHVTVIYWATATDVDTQLVLGVDYSFTAFVTDNMGQCAAPQITTTNPVANGDKLIVLLTPPGTQLTDIKNQNAFFATSHESEMDKLAMKDLSLQQQVTSAVVIPQSEVPSNFSLTLPHSKERANGYLAFDANGNLVVNQVAATQPSWLTPPVFLNAEVLNQTPNASAIYSLVNCKVALTPGTWELFPVLIYAEQGGSGITQGGFVLGSADGSNSNVPPALISLAAGVTAKDGTQLYTNLPTIPAAPGASGIIMNLPKRTIAVNKNINVFLVPYNVSTTPANVRIWIQLYAKLISLAVS